MKKVIEAWIDGTWVPQILANFKLTATERARLSDGIAITTHREDGTMLTIRRIDWKDRYEKRNTK